MCQQEIQSCLSAEPRGIDPGGHGPKERHFYPCLPKELLTAKEGLSRNKDFTQDLYDSKKQQLPPLGTTNHKYVGQSMLQF